MVVIAAGDTNGIINSNLNTATELVVLSSEGGFHAYAFPNNDTTWSNRKRLTFDGVNGLNVENQSITGSDVKIDGWGSVSASLAAASVDTNTTYSAGTLLDLSGTTFNVDLSELTDMTADVNGTQDELVLLDNGAQRRKLVSEINLGQFNNDQGWTSNTGDITGVTAGTGLSGGGNSGGVTLNLDFSELTDKTTDIAAATEFIIQDGTTESRKAASEIKLSVFNNDSGWTSNTGDVTGVTLAGDTGTASDTSGNVDLTIAGGTNISTSATGTTLTINNGITNNNQLTNGAGYTTNNGDVTGVTLAGDSGTASDTSGNVDLTIAGGTNITTSATGTTLTINNGITNNNQLTNGAGYTTNTGTVTEVTVGTGLDVATGTSTPNITLDLSEFTDMTAAVDGTLDELILLDNGAERRKLISEINLGQFNNDQGWTNNTGTVDTSGTPADNQIAVFTDSNTIEGTTGLTYDGSDLGVTGDINITKIGGVELTLAAATAGSTTIGLNPNTSGFGQIWTTDTSTLRLGTNATTAIEIDGSSQEVSITGNINTTGYVTGSFYNDRVSLGTNVDFSAGQVFTKTLSGNTTLTFSNYKVGMVKDLRIIGDHSLTFPAGCNVIGGGSYDGSSANFIQVICIDQSSPEFWVSISRV